MSPVLLKNGKMNLCMSMGSRENKQNKVRTQLWDTLYSISLNTLTQSNLEAGEGEDPAEVLQLPVQLRRVLVLDDTDG